MMFDNKRKALTFSYDDGVSQDIRLIQILNKYGLKATFNLNSGLFGREGTVKTNGTEVSHKRFLGEDIRYIYEGHEIAGHTITHARLPECTKEEVIREVEEDRQVLSELAGYEIRGMAYACGGVNNNDQVAQIIRENTGIRYARTITATGNFEPQENLYRFNPSVFHINVEEMFALGEKFLALKPDTPQIFYVWGHSYEFDAFDFWNRFEAFCEMMSGHADIFYGTNREVLL